MAGGTLKRWDGSNFKSGGTFKRWDGAQFKTGGTIRRWNGTAFVPAPGSPPTVMIIRQNNAEGGTDGTTVTTISQTGGASGDAFDQVQGGVIAFSAAQKANGTLSYKMDEAASSSVGLVWTPLAASNLTDFYTRMYLYYTAFPSASAFFERGMDVNVATLYRLSVSGTGGGAPGQVRLVDTTGTTVAHSTQQLSINTWYRLETHVVVSTGTGSLETRVYAGNDTTPLFTVAASSLNTGSLPLDNLSFGANVAAGSPTVATFYTDDMALASGGWIGPAS